MSTPKPYHWFQGPSVEALVKRLQDANPACCRLEVHQDGEHMTFRVVAVTGAARTDDPPINDSHLCPPICPE